MLVTHGFNSKIIDGKGEGDGSIGMSPNARSKRCWTVPVFSEVMFEAIIRYFAYLGKVVPTFANIDVDRSINN